ncbi:hypothetical protein KR75_26500 (plasmid) [Klebsiella variicola]|nr:hypothetical protein KR75_26500 [Klebsiella variicola]
MLTMDLRYRKLMSGLCSLSFHDWLLEWESSWHFCNTLIIMIFKFIFNIIFVMRTLIVGAQ